MSARRQSTVNNNTFKGCGGAGTTGGAGATTAGATEGSERGSALRALEQALVIETSRRTEAIDDSCERGTLPLVTQSGLRCHHRPLDRWAC